MKYLIQSLKKCHQPFPWIEMKSNNNKKDPSISITNGNFHFLHYKELFLIVEQSISAYSLYKIMGFIMT